jgi:hypothetical protein
VEKLRNKKDKTEKDQAMLLKMENELEVATQVYHPSISLTVGIPNA